MASVQQTKIVFGILSADTPADVVQQLVDSLGSDCRVVVHHDFFQHPDFSLNGKNVCILKDPVRTAWGDWSQVEGVLRMLRHALTHYQFDYFQLLSDSCLPIRPVHEFKQALFALQPDVMMDLIDLKADKDVFLSHAYRCYTSSNGFLHRIFRRSRVWALGPGPHVLKKIAGIGIPLARREVSSVDKVRQLIGESVTELLRMRDLVHNRQKVYLGSNWFCASREACENIVEQARNEKLVGFFSKLACPDEIFFSSVVGNSRFSNIVPANHFTIWRQRGTGPEELREADIPIVLDSGKFFARKFIKQANNPVRTTVLAGLASNEVKSERQ